MNVPKGFLFTILVIAAICLAIVPRVPSIVPSLWSTHTVLNPTTITYVTMTVATKCAWLTRTLSHVYLETTTVELRDPANLDLLNIALFIVGFFLAVLIAIFLWNHFVDPWTPEMEERARRARYGDLP
jgi:hypothetical protein